MLKRLILSVAVLLALIGPLPAEPSTPLTRVTINLKNGNTAAGTLISESKDAVVIDFNGTSLTFYTDEIADISKTGEPRPSPAAPAPATVAQAPLTAGDPVTRADAVPVSPPAVRKSPEAAVTLPCEVRLELTFANVEGTYVADKGDFIVVRTKKGDFIQYAKKAIVKMTTPDGTPLPLPSLPAAETVPSAPVPLPLAGRLDPPKYKSVYYSTHTAQERVKPEPRPLTEEQLRLQGTWVMVQQTPSFADLVQKDRTVHEGPSRITIWATIIELGFNNLFALMATQVKFAIEGDRIYNVHWYDLTGDYERDRVMQYATYVLDGDTLTLTTSQLPAYNHQQAVIVYKKEKDLPRY